MIRQYMSDGDFKLYINMSVFLNVEMKGWSLGFVIFLSGGERAGRGISRKLL